MKNYLISINVPNWEFMIIKSSNLDNTFVVSAQNRQSNDLTYYVFNETQLSDFLMSVCNYNINEFIM